MTNYLIVPGLGNSGPDHWQTYFEKSAGNFHRVTQAEWDEPNCIDWITTIDRAISTFDPSTIILIGHSLGCSTIAHWAQQYKINIKGALLVAPSDLEAPNYNFPAKGFAPIPTVKINFKTVVVASSNDPWVSLERARYFSNNWGSNFINMGDAGHINAASGYGNWPGGLAILKTLG